MKNLNVIEVCAGAGGMAMGFERAGFESLALAELNNAAVKTLHKNFAGKNVIAGDITKDEVKADIVAAAYKSKVESLMAKNPDMDFDTLLNIAIEQGSDISLLCGGIPCQSYSILGKKKHMDCDNGMLFDHFLQLADCIKPKVLLIENVEALVSAEDSNVIEYMLAEFRKIGYYASFQENKDLYSTVKVLNAADYGVPQRRMRVFVVAIRQDVWDKAKAMGITYNFPEPTHIGKHITLREAIKDVPESKYLTYSDNVIKVLQSASPGKAANIDLFDKSLLDENGDFAISVKRFSRYRRLDFDRVCHTVAASEPNTLCHPEYDRPLNINEIKRIQSFPDDFEFCGGVAEVYKQIGNAVPVLLAQAMATSIAEFLNAVQNVEVESVADELGKKEKSEVFLSLCDMSELYSILLEKCDGDIPSILVVKKMAGIFSGMSHQFFKIDASNNNIMLIFEESDMATMKSNLLKYLEEFKNIDKSTLEVIVGLGMPLAHRRDIYKHAISISNSLNIVCPQIIALPDKDLPDVRGRRITVFDDRVIDKDIPIGDYIYVKNQGRSRMIHTIAHELRHCWQEYRSNEGFYINYREFDVRTRLEYNFQREEVDAEAFASLYAEKSLGVNDGTELMYDSIEDIEFFKDLTFKVKECMCKLSA